jgi:hypothetical protein
MNSSPAGARPGDRGWILESAGSEIAPGRYHVRVTVHPLARLLDNHPGARLHLMPELVPVASGASTRRGSDETRYRTVKRTSWSTAPSVLRSSTRHPSTGSLLMVVRLYVR